ncbi:MAG: HDIG domain-containing protein [Bacteroidales bacterium]|nr:HDIG domain-containing protein [Bacteroidales bacterium]
MKRILTFIRDHYAWILKFLLFIISLGALVWIFPTEGKFKYEYQRARPWMHDDLIAPFDFAILKSAEELDHEKNAALEGFSPYFRMQEEQVYVRREELRAELEAWLQKKGDSSMEGVYSSPRQAEIVLTVFDSLMSRGVIELIPEMEGWHGDRRVMLLMGNEVRPRMLKDFFTVREADRFIINTLNRHREGIDVRDMTALLENHLYRNVTYDKETTAKARQQLIDGISLTRGMVQAGERIISRGELVTHDKFQILESLRMAFETKLGHSYRYLGIVTGQLILITIALAALFLFLYFFRKDVYVENKRIILILVLIVSMVFLASLLIRYDISALYVLPVCLIPIIIRVFYDTRLALFVHLITIIIMGFLVPNSFEFIFLQLFAGIVTILSIARLERRSQFFLTSLVIFLTYSAIYTGMTLIQEGTLDGIQMSKFVLFSGSAVLTLFSYPVIFVFEKLFGMITDVTLMELSNTNNRLLRELAMRAPGTFQHSMQVANLAEEAIYEIGGHPLMVRTGAMYHDIGKLEMPLYFIENQTTGVNPHDELTYDESAQIIISHVIRGIERARKHKLPEQIIDFIRTHHGTTRVEYFYYLHKQDMPEGEEHEEIFRYPGPVPFSKETAVLMMADSVEAATRSIQKPDEARISGIVDQIIDRQMESGQFNNSDITLRDLSRIKKIFKKKLMNIYHLRIEYPG